LVQLNHYFKQPVLNSHLLNAQRLMELLQPDAQQVAIKEMIATVLQLIPAEQAQSGSQFSGRDSADASQARPRRKPQAKNLRKKPRSEETDENAR
jgi:hypothetical protein